MHLKPVVANIGLACLVALAAAPRLATADDLATAATNPIGDLIQVQLQYQHGTDIYDLDGDSDTWIVQPVIPFDLPWESVPNMISRTTIPAHVSTPDFPGSGSVDDVGDTVFLGFLMPKLETSGVMFGIGPALGLPTASEDEIGSDARSPTVFLLTLLLDYWDKKRVRKKIGNMEGV